MYVPWLLINIYLIILLNEKKLSQLKFVVLRLAGLKSVQFNV